MTKSLPKSGAEVEMAGKDEATQHPILVDWEHAGDTRDGTPKIGFE